MELDDALEHLAAFGDVRARPMPGGHGLSYEGIVFAVFVRGRLYFHTDDESRAAYVERGMEPFAPRPGASPFRYYEVPDDVLADPALVAAWSGQALASRPAADGTAGRRRNGVRSPRSSGVAPSPSRPG